MKHCHSGEGRNPAALAGVEKTLGPGLRRDDNSDDKS